MATGYDETGRAISLPRLGIRGARLVSPLAKDFLHVSTDLRKQRSRCLTQWKGSQELFGESLIRVPHRFQPTKRGPRRSARGSSRRRSAVDHPTPPAGSSYKGSSW
jgi:hypothetical protein